MNVEQLAGIIVDVYHGMAILGAVFVVSVIVYLTEPVYRFQVWYKSKYDR